MVPDVTPVVYLPRDTCPNCGVSLFGEYVAMVQYRTGRRKTGWSVYHCHLCGRNFRVAWPGVARRAGRWLFERKRFYETPPTR